MLPTHRFFNGIPLVLRICISVNKGCRQIRVTEPLGHDRDPCHAGKDASPSYASIDADVLSVGFQDTSLLQSLGFLLAWCETRKMKCDCPVGSRLPTAQQRQHLHFLSPWEENANESLHSDQNRQFSVRKLAVLAFGKVFSLFTAAQILHTETSIRRT